MNDVFRFKPKGSDKIYSYTELIKNKDHINLNHIKVYDNTTGKIFVTDIKTIESKFG